jgi:hypothetical protein
MEGGREGGKERTWRRKSRVAKAHVAPYALGFCEKGEEGRRE